MPVDLYVYVGAIIAATTAVILVLIRTNKYTRD